MIESIFQRAIALHRSGDLDTAAGFYEDILRQAPEHAGAWHLLGVVYLGRKQYGAAREHIEKALSLCNTKAIYHNNHGVALRELGDFEGAKAAFERALEIYPNYPDALSNLGLVQHELGDINKAEAALLHALSLQPQHLGALLHLAALYNDKGEPEEAAARYRDVLRLCPDHTEAMHGFCNSLVRMGRWRELLEVWHRRITLEPTDGEAHLALGDVYACLNQTEEAKQCYNTAVKLQPENTIWRWRHLRLCPTVFPDDAAIDRYRADLEKQLDKALESPPSLAWRDVLREGFSPPIQLIFHGKSNRSIKEKFAALFTSIFPKTHLQCQAKKRIRVGFLAPHSHEGSFLRGCCGLMGHLDRKHFEVVGIVPRDTFSFYKKGIQGRDVEWVGLPYHYARAVETIQSVQCDILYHWQIGSDLLGYFLPFYRLAPIQCTSASTPGTTGIGNVDYFISSELVEKEDADEDYTESLVRFQGMPKWQPRLKLPVKASRRELGLPECGALYYGPQRVEKHHSDFDDLLHDILCRDKNGWIVILQKNHEGGIAQSLRDRMHRKLGESLFRRILFLPTRREAEYYRLLSVMDVLLDGPTYNSFRTGFDAFALGIPVVTMPGRYMVQRYTQGLYRRMGITNLVAEDRNHYIDLAVQLGTECDFQRAMSQKILERNSILFEDYTAVEEHEMFFKTVVSQNRSTGICGDRQVQ